MSPLNRRDFLKSGSMAVVAAGVVTAVPGALPIAAGASGLKSPGIAESESGAEESGGTLDQPLVAHVRNLDTGEIGIFYGQREITFRNPQLAAQLHRAAT
jgi:hypothetical protein